MAKRNFTIFVLLGVTIVLIGVIFLLLGKDMFIPGFVSDSEDISVNGWPIVIIGVAMLFMGLLMKWSGANDQRKNKDIKYPPPTEEVNKEHQRYYGE